MLCIIILCTGFTSFVKKIEQQPADIKGNPDPNAGIVVRFDSTPEMILTETSDAIRFSATMSFDEKHINHLRIPLLDQRPQKFTLMDEKLGFQANTTYYFSVSFDEKTHIWTEMNFTPFLPAYFKTEEDLKPYLDEWIRRLDDAGWEQARGDEQWEPFKLPTTESMRSSKTYQVWTKDCHRITLFVERKTYLNPTPDKYNLRIYIINDLPIKNR